jgi:hypothetical protein
MRCSQRASSGITRVASRGRKIEAAVWRGSRVISNAAHSCLRLAVPGWERISPQVQEPRLPAIDRDTVGGTTKFHIVLTKVQRQAVQRLAPIHELNGQLLPVKWEILDIGRRGESASGALHELDATIGKNP